MGIPSPARLEVPILELLRDGPRSRKLLCDLLAERFRLTEEERRERFASGGLKLRAYVQHALGSLLRSGRIERVAHGVYGLTARGENGPPRPAGDEGSDRTPARTIVYELPEEALERLLAAHERELRDDLLAQLRRLAPESFERLVLDLLKAMGYGARGRLEVVGGPNDRGVDGIVTEDALGLEIVYVQAKRFAESAVKPRHVREFAGALDERGASKGVFITTSRFTRDAREAASRSPKRIVLLDGSELARLMLEHGVGVRTVATFALRSLDEDYFENL